MNGHGADAVAAQPDLFLMHVAVALVLALLLGHACRRYLGAPVVGELVAGMLLGPSVAGFLPTGVEQWVSPVGDQAFDTLAQVAVLLLVGVTGMQLNFAQLRREQGTVYRIAAAAFVLPAALGVAAAALLPRSMWGHEASRGAFIALVAVLLAVSALPVAAVALRQAGLLNQRIGQLVLAAASLDDLAGWLLLSVVAVAGASSATAFVMVVGVGLLLAVLVGGVPIANRLVCTVKAWGDGPSLVVIVAVIVLGAAVSRLLGLEPVLGAMVAGVLLGRCAAPTPAVSHSLDLVASWVCAPLFLVAAGARLDVRTLTSPTILAAGLGLLLVAFLGKIAGGYLGARWGGLPPRLAWTAGAVLNARGMVEIVVAAMALRIGVFSPQMYTVVVGIALITSLCVPFALRAAMPQTRVGAARPAVDLPPA